MTYTSSGSLNFLGVGSDIDFTTMIEQLKQVESYKLYSLEDSWSVASDKYDAVTDLISTISEAQELLASLNSPDEFLTKLATSSVETVASAVATSSATDGTYSIEVKQLASNAIWASQYLYSSSTEVINTSSESQTFMYTYMGTTCSVDVPPGTTLEGFANIVNQNSNNPGVNLSLIQVADGYVFQIAGTDSGADATLEVYGSNLTGMGASDSEWTSTSAVDLDAIPNEGEVLDNYTATITMLDGTSFSTAPLAGNLSAEDLATAINTAYGSDIASISNSKLVLAGDVSSIVLESYDTAGDIVSTSTATTTATTTATFTGELDDVFTDSTSGFTGEYTFLDSTGVSQTITLTGTTDEDTGVTSYTYTDLFTALGDAGCYIEVTSETDEDTGDTTSTAIVSGISDLGDLPLTYSSTEYSDVSMTLASTSTLQSDVVPASLTYSFLLDDNTVLDVVATSSDSLRDVLDEAIAQGANISYSIDDSGKLVLSGVSSVSGYDLSGKMTASSTWSIKDSCNAIFNVNDGPYDATSTTNTATGVLEGITLTLFDVGTTQITIATDTDSVKANIQAFLDIVNSVIQKVQDLTAVEVDEGSDLYDSSGAVASSTTAAALTGEYSVQLFKSRLTAAITGTPSGFQTMTGEDIFSGDFITSLAQMGIKISTTENSSDYGLFVIAPEGSTDAIQALDQELFDTAISENLDAVINFFAADDTGTSSSSYFRYSSHIDGITQPGTYDIAYSVDADGNPYDVYINGALASASELANYTFTAGSDAGDAQGISIVIDNLTEGSYTGNVSIQRGKVQELENFFSDELTYVSFDIGDTTLTANNGGLMILQNSYSELMTSLEEQISEEIDRLDAWEYTQRMKYARLDTLLAEYSYISETLTSQLSQLDS